MIKSYNIYEFFDKSKATSTCFAKIGAHNWIDIHQGIFHKTKLEIFPIIIAINGELKENVKVFTNEAVKVNRGKKQ